MNCSFAAYWRALANGTRKGLPDRLLLALLIPLSLPYFLAQRLRAVLYRAGILKTGRLPRPVVAVGNITVGGTGKTPVTALIARLLLERGMKVAVLSRGYGGSLEGQAAIVSDGSTVFLTAEQCGDEPYLLATTVPGLMVVIGSDRHGAGMLALEQLSPDIYLLDDGFQHLALHRDLNILLLDCTAPFGNGWTLPAGLLREPASAAARADLVIHTRCPEGAIPSAVAGKPQCRARHRLGSLVLLSGGIPLDFATLQGRKMLAFAGIAEPQRFFDGLAAQGLDLVRAIPLPDHARYAGTFSAELTAAMDACGAEYAVTTEKDGVKLRNLPPGLANRIVLARLELAIDDLSLLAAPLYNLLQK